MGYVAYWRGSENLKLVQLVDRGPLLQVGHLARWDRRRLGGRDFNVDSDHSQDVHVQPPDCLHDECRNGSDEKA